MIQKTTTGLSARHFNALMHKDDEGINVGVAVCVDKQDRH